MNKNRTLYVNLILIILCFVGFIWKTPIQTFNVVRAKESLLNTNTITKKEVFGYFKLDKESLLKKLGRDYKIILNKATNAHEYRYTNKGLVFVFDDNNYLEYIECGKRVNIDGATIEMNFSQIQQKLGKRKIEEFHGTEPGQKTNYTLIYEMDDLLVYFSSTDKTGKNMKLIINVKSTEEPTYWE